MKLDLSVMLDDLDLSQAPFDVRAFSAPEPVLDATAAGDIEAMPDGRYWPRDLHGPSVVTFTVRISAATEALALAAVNTLRKAARTGAVLSVRQDAQTDTLTKLVYHAEVVALDYPDYDAQQRQNIGLAQCIVTLTCYPYWVAPEQPLTPNLVANGLLKSYNGTAPYGWPALSTVESASLDAYLADGVLGFTFTADNTNLAYGRVVPCVVGKTYTASADIAVSALTPTTYVKLEVLCTGGVTTDFPSAPFAANSTGRASVTFTVPEGTTSTSVRFRRVSGTPTTGVARIARVQVIEGDTDLPFRESTVYAPGVVTYDETDGEVPALTAIKATAEQAITSLALGLRSQPPASFASSAVQDYSGTADANALGGEVKRLVTSTAWQVVATAPEVDTEDMRGRYVMWARRKWSAGTTANTARASSDVTGSGIAVTTTVPATAQAMPFGVAASAAATFLVGSLGEVSVPAAEVPSAQSTAGYGAEATLVDITTGTDKTLVSDWVAQTFVPTNALISALKFNGAGGSFHLMTWESGAPGTVLSSRMNTGTLYAGLSIPVTPGATYCLRAGGYGSTVKRDTSAPSATGTGYHSPDGSTGWTAGDGTDTTVDYGITVKTRPKLGFAAHTPVQAKATSGTPNFDLDNVALLPCDEAYLAVTWAAATSAGQGVLVNEMGLRADESNVYLTDSSGGIGASLIAQIDPRNPFLLRPGTNSIVVHAATPGGAAPGAVTVSGSYRPRYLTLSKGD